MHFNLADCVISETQSIKSALIQIEKNTLGMVLSYDDNEKIVGILTDGDIRRGLLSGLDLDGRVANCANRQSRSNGSHVHVSVISWEAL